MEPTGVYGNVDMNSGDVITLSCEGVGVINHPLARKDLHTATVSCVEGENFKNEEWLSSPAQFSLFKCSLPPNYSSRRTDRKCYNRNPIYEVGYSVENVFYPVYESCFDEGRLNAVYSKYTQKPYNAFYQTKVDRPFFISNGTYGSIPVEQLFSPPSQKSAVAQLVGTNIDTYVTKSQFLARGHLAAKTDFVFAFGERATFHYVNCAPQWSGFNGGNWNTLEVDLRERIHTAGYSTVIFTGTFGVSQLLSDSGRKVDLYLYKDVNNNPVIPVPQYFYKVVYDPSSKCGVAFVGINNPYYTPTEAQEMFFCEDLCRNNNNFSWLSWVPDSPNEGFTFCCTVPDFRMTVPHLPEFQVDCFLT